MCSDLEIKLVFTPFKIKSWFGAKDPIPAGLRSRVIYKFSYTGCSACYIGETNRHFATHIREHLASDKNSHIFKHLKGSVNCGSLCSEDCFKILDSASTSFQSFSSPEATLLLVSTKNRDLWPSPTPKVRDSRTSRHSAHVQSQVWQIWLVLVSIYCIYKANQKRNVVGLGQRSRFLVLTKRSAASGDENGFQLKIKEAMHILWEQPSLNSQVQHLNLSLSY